MPSISVLCPSRGRASRLRDSLQSLLGHATARAGTEILVALDPDDPEGTLAPRLMEGTGEARFWIAPQRSGYARINEYFNALAALAAGEWLMLWNDDATMLTPGWDEIIAGQAPGVLWPGADYAPQINTFPIWPRAWFQALGHVSPDQSADMWMAEVGRLSGTMRKIPVSIHHEHLRGDATAGDRDAVADVATFHTPAMCQAREADAAVIRGLLA
jgi:hypothetical protein